MLFKNPNKKDKEWYKKFCEEYWDDEEESYTKEE